MKLFIDTNIFLSFYHLTSEDLEELEKLVVLIKNKEISLMLPEQVIDETKRNRSSKINDSLEIFKRAKFSLSYPAYCKGYEQYEKMRNCQKVMDSLHSDMLKLMQKDIEDQSLAADILIKRLFSVAKVIERTPQILSRARERVELRNPPGKKGSLGDAVNWESLLSSVPEYFDLKLIADDSDFYSPLNTNKINEFLKDEWESKKKTKPKFYRKLSSFFKDCYPSINLAAELEKDILIERLAASSNFATTHSVIAELSKCAGFTQKQVEDIVNALLLNNQVQWIVGDEDVNTFYKMIYDKYFFSVLDYSDELKVLLFPENEPIMSGDDIPF